MSGIVSDNPIISSNCDEVGVRRHGLQFDSGIYYYYVERTVRYFIELLDLPTQNFIREDHGFDSHGGLNKRVFKYLHGQLLCQEPGSHSHHNRTVGCTRLSPA